MTVDQGRFVSAMQAHWQDTLRNTTNPALEAVWGQMADAFNQQIRNHGTEAGKRWQVLQPATGTGKTQGLAVYCSLLAGLGLDPHEALDTTLLEGGEGESPGGRVGVLIVTRLKEQANDISTAINGLAGRTVAVPRHTDSKLEPEQVAAAQVLVVTHAAYERALDRVREVGDQHWSSFTQWDCGPRKLIVIDEAIDLVKDSQVVLGDVSFLLGVIPPETLAQFPEQRTLIQEVAALLAKMGELADLQSTTDQTPQEKVLWQPGMMQMPPELSMTGLRTVCRGLEWDRIIARKHSARERQTYATRIDQTLTAIEATVRNWRWYSKKGKLHTLNAAALIVPDDVEGAVVLDATAGVDLVYDLFEQKADRLPPPAGARSYTNVQLHVSRSLRGVGKASMVEHAKDRVAALLGDLEHSLGTDSRQVLVVCHKDVEPELAGLRCSFGEMKTAHWGAIDGRNQWNAYDTVVIFGLPYRDRIWSANTFMAFQGIQSSGWLNDPAQRGFKQFADIRQSLEVHQLIVSAVQAINRVRCRRVIDSDGNCARTDAFIYLPPDKTGDAILAGIQRNMPGVRVCDWTTATVKPKSVRKTFWEEVLVARLSAMPRGEVSASAMQKQLGVSRATWERLASQMKDHDSVLFARLVELGVSYVVQGAGPKRRAYICKA